MSVCLFVYVVCVFVCVLCVCVFVHVVSVMCTVTVHCTVRISNTYLNISFFPITWPTSKYLVSPKNFLFIQLICNPPPPFHLLEKPYIWILVMEKCNIQIFPFLIVGVGGGIMSTVQVYFPQYRYTATPGKGGELGRIKIKNLYVLV